MIAQLFLATALMAGPGEDVQLLHTELDAVAWAFDALQAQTPEGQPVYPPERQPFVRFVYLPPWADAEWPGAVDFVVNAAASHSEILQRGNRHAGGYLLGYDLQRLCPDPVKLARLVSVWDGIAVKDSRFHVPKINQVKGQSLAILAPHLQAALAKHVGDPKKDQRVDLLVTQLTSSTGGIYPADFLIEQFMTSIRGVYPELRQLEFGKPEKFTPLQAHLQKRGFFFEQSTNLRGDQGVWIKESGVTGKNRIVMATYGLSSRTPLSVTFDSTNQRTRPDEQFIRNLIEFRPFSDASEVFVPLPNGLLEYILADGKGNLVRQVPDNIALDTTKPNPHTKELEMGMSCVLCHAPDGGYKTNKNDLEFLLGSSADFLGDSVTILIGGKPTLFTRDQAVALVAGRYGERLDDGDGILGRAERDYLKAVSSITDYRVLANEPSAVVRLGAKIKEIYHRYRFTPISAQTACVELGVKVQPEKALQTLRLLVPTPPLGQTEDVMIALFKNGLEINRDDMDAIFNEMAQRAIPARAELRKGKQ